MGVDPVDGRVVDPGFGGQAFIEGMLGKVRRLRSAVTAAGADVRIQVDVVVSVSTIAVIARAGADVFVAGSAVYGHEDPAAAIAETSSTPRSRWWG